MKTNFNFIRFRLVFITISLIFILFSLWLILGPRKLNLGVVSAKGFNLGVDFQGGVVHQVTIYSGISQDKIRALAIESGLGNDVQKVIISDNKRLSKMDSYLVKTIITEKELEEINKKPDMTSSKYLEEKIKNFHKKIMETTSETYTLEGEELKKAIKIYGENQIPGEIVELRTSDKRVVNNVVKENQNVISPVYSLTLKWQSLFLIGFVFLIILIYISVRFKFEYSLGAILALLHDTIIILGIISFFRLELDMTLIAAVLTLIGYSVNDTIVIFDRIKENFVLMKDSPPKTVFNVSINQVLSRTIITSLTTLLAVLALFLFGGEKIKNFSLILIVGIIIGTYSSIFIASPIVDYWDIWFSKRKIKETKEEDKKIEDKKLNEKKDNKENNINNDEDIKMNLSKKQLKKLSNKKK